jgi:hypothetical protein
MGFEPMMGVLQSQWGRPLTFTGGRPVPIRREFQPQPSVEFR